MILLDTDHLTTLKYRGTERYNRLSSRLIAASPVRIGTTIINVEEQMRGWLAAIGKERTTERQVNAYRELTDLFAFFAAFQILSLNSEAASLFDDFRVSGVRISTMDLKIASIAIAHQALLLTANRRDFEKVPGLRFENWLDEQRG